LFIGGLPQNATANELREHFEKFGVVSDAVVMIDPATNRSRGFGFVCFLPGQEGATAVTSTLEQYDNHRMRGKWIEVKSAAPPHKLAAKNATAQDAGAPKELSYEELALSGALPGLSRPETSPTPSLENREPNQRKREVSSLGSPRKVELPGNAERCNNPMQAPPLGLAANEFGSFRARETPSHMPWWSAQPWLQPFGQGYGGLPPFAQTPAPFGFGEGVAPPVGTDYFRGPPFADQSGLSVADTLQRNLEQFLRQSSQHKMEWDANKGTPRDPSVSTTCSAAISSDAI